MEKIVVTGGAGFIASHVVDHFVAKYPSAEIVVVDKMGYAARSAYLNTAMTSGRVTLVEASICDTPKMKQVLKDTDLVVHAAAESHVDNSFRDVKPFLQDNIVGTINLLDAAIYNDVGLFFHCSTDEVYGESAVRNFTDEEPLNPTNPYAASKASAEMFLRSYAASYGLRTRISRANNIYGPRQYPEKLIPKLICDAARGSTFFVHGQGTAVRSFLSVYDFCTAIDAIIEHGADGEIYNIPAINEYSVLQVVDLVSKEMGIDPSSFVRFGPNRPHNDCRYGVCGEKILSLGWSPTRTLEQDIGAIVEWYTANLDLYYGDDAAAKQPNTSVGRLQAIGNKLFKKQDQQVANLRDGKETARAS